MVRLIQDQLTSALMPWSSLPGRDFPETVREPRCIANPSGIFALPRNTRPCSGKIARFLPPETLPSGTAHRSWGRLVSPARDVPARDRSSLVPVHGFSTRQARPQAAPHADLILDKAS